MPVTHKAKIDTTGELITLLDPTRLRSATMFKFISDKLLDRAYNPEAHFQPQPLGQVSGMNAVEAATKLNAVLAKIDPRLVVLGTEATRRFLDDLVDDIFPVEVNTGTEIFDKTDGLYRRVATPGETEIAIFTDGHVDWHRRLRIGFDLTPKPELGSTVREVRAIYSLARSQPYQGSPTWLDAWVDTSGTREVDETLRKPVNDILINPDQEEAFLRVIAEVGDVSLSSFN